MLVQDRRRWAVGKDDPLGIEHDEPVDEVDPPGQPVLDDHEGQPPLAGHDVDEPSHGACGRRVEHRRGLVEQQDAGLHRQRARERKTLRLPTAQRGRRAVRRHGQPDLSQRRSNPWRHLATRQLDVLEAERDIPADRRGDHSGPRVLEHQADRTGAVLRRLPVDGHGPRQVTRVRGQEQSGHRSQQGRLPRTARPGEQHPLAGLDGQVQAGQDRAAPAVGTPGEVLDTDAGSGGRASPPAGCPRGRRG